MYGNLFECFINKMGEALDKNTYSSIVKHVLASREQAAAEQCKEFNQFINSTVEVKGFRNSSAAPPELLVNEIVKCATISSSFSRVVIFTWIDFWPEASKIAGQLVTQHLPGLTSPEESNEEEADEDKINDFIAVAVEQMIEKVDCTTQEATVLICAEVLNELSDEDSEVEEEVNNNEDSVWDKFLEEAKELPADSPEWQNVEQFVESLQKLAKTRVVQSKKLFQLEKALRELKQKNKDDLVYFGLEGTEHWVKDYVSLEKADTLVEQIGTLKELFSRHKKIESLPSTSVSDARKQRKQLTDLEAAIDETYKRIEKVMGDKVKPGDISCGKARPTADLEPDPDAGSGLDSRQEPVPELESEPESEPEDRMESANDPGEKEAETVTVGGQGDLTAKNVAAHADEDIGRLAGDTEMGKLKVALPVDKGGGVNEQDLAPVGEIKAGDDRFWSDYCWEMMLQDDLAGAYWLCTSLEARGKSGPVPGWLLQAVQGARWLSMDSNYLVDDITRIARDQQPGDGEAEELLGLAASLRPAVIAPAAGLLGWLNFPGCTPAFNGLVKAIKEFAHYGRALYNSDLRSLQGVEQFEEDIKEIVRNTRQWLDGALLRRTKLARANNVWAELLKNEDELKGFLVVVARDLRDEWPAVQEKVKLWSDRAYIDSRIVDIDRKLLGRRVPAITGAPREQIIRYVKDACQLAASWCEFVKRDSEIKADGGDWFADRITALRSGIQAQLKDVQAGAQALMKDTSKPGCAAAAACLLRAVEQLSGDLDITVQPVLNPVYDWHWLVEGAENIDFAFMKRLLLLPEIDLDNWGMPAEVPKIADALRKGRDGGQSLKEIILQWLQKEDFRFVQYLISMIDDEDKKAELTDHYEQGLKKSAIFLEDELHKVNGEIEQAVVDGVLSDEERAAHLSKLENIDLKESLDYCIHRAKIVEVRQLLLDSRDQRLKQLNREWAQIESSLQQHPGDENKKAEIVEAVTHALGQGDIRVVEECIAQLIELMDLGDPLKDNPFSLPAGGDERHAFKRYMGMAGKLEGLLEKQSLRGLQNMVNGNKTWGGLKFRRFPRPLKEEVIKAIDSWRWLKQGSAEARTNADHIGTILRYLGFNVDTDVTPGSNRQQRGEHWLYQRVEMSTGGRAPIPQFGSQQQNYFDVVCLWERPSVDTLTSWMKDLNLESKNILVIYLGRMSLRMKNVMRQMTADRGLIIVVLDEILFAYLSAERLGRLQPFFHCTLPFAMVNPYTPFRAGDVPPEMFFGRKAMAREIQRSEGSCIVYGGRQLGKSALLRHVQREFHNPEREQYAFVEDIKLVGSPSSGMRPQAIWTKLRDIFQALGLLSTKEKSESPEKIAKLVEKAIQRNPHCRVLVLFDEADNFLDADSEKDFNVVDGLRILMSKTERRFKVVLAGLHNVQRFQGRGNQPLAHFGTPICVGPLEPDAAQGLIREPLETLGFYFTDNSIVLSILSYTNYHPGLIQLFCQELLNSIDIPPGQDPPYRIGRDEVESVYRKPEVRARICERFDWTLALDRRYQAIAWTMIYDQSTSASNGFSQTYAPGEILILVGEWWPQGFEGIESDQLRGLLDEMCGLGVLVRNNEGHYRLRSPNLVRLMEDVEGRLWDLLDKEPELKGFDPDSYRALLADGNYNPLTFAQESNLNQQRFGVGLVFASEALGGARLETSFQRFIPLELPVGTKTEVKKIPLNIKESVSLESWLEKYLKRRDQYERLVLFSRLQNANLPLPEMIDLAIEFTRRHSRRRRQWLRILFILDPAVTWEWLKYPGRERLKLEDKADIATPLRRWNIRAVKQRLAQKGKIHSEEVCRDILRVTGGWPWLLDELFLRCNAEEDDPRPGAAELDNELNDLDSPLLKGFKVSLGLGDWAEPQKVLRFIAHEKGVPQELAEPKQLAELMHGEAGMSVEESEAGLILLKHLGIIETRENTLYVEPVVWRVLGER